MEVIETLGKYTIYERVTDGPEKKFLALTADNCDKIGEHGYMHTVDKVLIIIDRHEDKLYMRLINTFSDKVSKLYTFNSFSAISETDDAVRIIIDKKLRYFDKYTLEEVNDE